MKKIAMSLAAIALSLALLNETTTADVDVGVSADSEGLKSFYLSIGEHYKVPEKQVVIVRQKRIPDEELPVVFFIARHASVEHGLIVDLRLGGKAWIDITAHIGLSPAIYYVAFERDPGPPYGKAWGHYKKHKKSEWKKIRLTDTDVVNFVNIKFMSERYGYSPHEVIKMRGKGDNFVYLNTKIKKQKEEKKMHSKKQAKAEKSNNDKPGKSKSKGKKD